MHFKNLVAMMGLQDHLCPRLSCLPFCLPFAPKQGKSIKSANVLERIGYYSFSCSFIGSVDPNGRHNVFFTSETLTKNDLKTHGKEISIVRKEHIYIVTF
jgi:hypothetical protein